MKQPTELNKLIVQQGEAVIVLDLDRIAKEMSLDKAMYLNAQIASRLLDALRNVEPDND